MTAMTPTTDDVAGLAIELNHLIPRYSSDQSILDAARDLLSSQARALREMEEEVRECKQLREIVGLCASALPNGAFVSPECSLTFMRLLPTEITAAFNRIESRALAAEARLKEAEKVIRDLMESSGLGTIRAVRAARAFLNAGEK